MRAISRPHASMESHPLIELGRRRILRTQPENVESAPGRLHDPADQLPANPEAPIGRQDVQMPHSADTLRFRMRIDVEPAHADHSPTYQGSEEGFAGAVKPIRSAGPLLSEPAHEPTPGLLALGDHGINGLGQQLTQAFDDHAVLWSRAICGRFDYARCCASPLGADARGCVDGSAAADGLKPACGPGRRYADVPLWRVLEPAAHGARPAMCSARLR